MSSPFHRPTFDATARVVARRMLPMGDRVYEPGQEMAAADREQITASQLASWWQQGLIDTPPRAESQPAKRK